MINQTPIKIVNQAPLSWVDFGFSYLGLKEIKGQRHAPAILKWLDDLPNNWYRNDEVAWCGTYIGACLQNSDRVFPRAWYRAKAYLKIGTELARPAYGSIAVISRKGGGHVFIVVGRTEDGHLVGLGGNQGDAVSLAKFKQDAILGYRWPASLDGKRWPTPQRYCLPVYPNTLPKPRSVV